MSYQEKSAEVLPGITINYYEAGDAKHPCLVLIHGYPQTCYQFRNVMKPLADRGFYVIAPDCRGAGKSTVTESGYDKWTLSKDIYLLYHDILKKDKAIILGVDIGSMVATALALQFRDNVLGLFACECPQPGTSTYDFVTTDNHWKYENVYHFFFHMAPNNWAEHLTVGKEKFYINSFFTRLAKDENFLASNELDVYAESFKGWDRMRAGFELYRAFLQDAEDTKKSLKEYGKLQFPVLASGGDASHFTELCESMMKEVAEKVTFESVKDAGHWIPEEQPERFVELVAKWGKTLV